MRGWGRCLLVLAGALGCGVLGAGCSTTQAAKDFGGPLSVIPRTDVVVETNIQAVVQAAQTVLQTTQSMASFGAASSGGMDVTTGPSTTAGQISYAIAPGGEGGVFAGWNHTDDHCLGMVYVASPVTTPILGETSPGQYEFVDRASSSSQCDAASFVGQSAAPSGWPRAPSSSGWQSS